MGNSLIANIPTKGVKQGSQTTALAPFVKLSVVFVQYECKCFSSTITFYFVIVPILLSCPQHTLFPSTPEAFKFQPLKQSN